MVHTEGLRLENSVVHQGERIQARLIAVGAFSLPADTRLLSQVASAILSKPPNPPACMEVCAQTEEQGNGGDYLLTEEDV